MNLAKHIKSPQEEWLLADSSPLPGRARSPRLVGEYIKDRKRRYAGNHPNTIKPAPLLIRVEGPAARDQLERFIRSVNRQWRRAGTPLKAKLL